jgi:2-polyprenyl-6-methoxyphenol hydroxylase-like FAD-dependent oxidoreductase
MGGRTATVVGGGISGLASAVALYERGWRVRVFERAVEFGEVGAGISMWPNALRALDQLGLGEKIRGLGGIEVHAGIRRRDGTVLVRTDLDAIIDRFGPVIIVHRADLLRTLVEALPAECLRPGSEVSTVDSIEGDLVVGADGLHSTVRAALFPAADPPRYSGYTAWRFITRRLDQRPAAGESWGCGERFGYAAMPDGRVYCYATANTPEGAAAPDELAELRRRFTGWHEPIRDLLAATEPEAVLRHDIYDLPDLPAYVRGRVALVGDAAHAMTPNLGQGACQGIEDATALAELLDRNPDVPAALAAYDSARRRHTQSIVALSRRTGYIGQWSSRIGVSLRDRLLPMVPPSFTQRSLIPMLEWRLPAAG